MNLTEQLDQLRDGDIVRVQGDGWAIEGPINDEFGDFRVEVENGKWALPITSGVCSILRPLLQPGDRVRWWRNSSLIGTVVRVDDVNASVVVGASKTAFTWLVTDCERLPAEPAPQPTVEVGQWWEFRGTPRVIVAVLGVVIRFRRWDTEEVNNSTEDEVHTDWTRLDGPPEPPVGAVYVIGSDVWQHGTGHRCIAGINKYTWIQVRNGYNLARLATLRVLAVLDPA